MGKRYVSLIAKVGDYSNIDEDLVNILKAIPKDAPFEEVVKAINSWGRNEVAVRRAEQYAGRSYPVKCA